MDVYNTIFDLRLCENSEKIFDYLHDHIPVFTSTFCTVWDFLHSASQQSVEILVGVLLCQKS